MVLGGGALLECNFIASALNFEFGDNQSYGYCGIAAYCQTATIVQAG